MKIHTRKPNINQKSDLTSDSQNRLQSIIPMEEDRNENH